MALREYGIWPVNTIKGKKDHVLPIPSQGTGGSSHSSELHPTCPAVYAIGKVRQTIVQSFHLLPCLNPCSIHLHLSNIDVFEKNQQAFTVLLSNGTITTMHFGRNDRNELYWGIKHQKNHVNIQHSTCGVGLLDASRYHCENNRDIGQTIDMEAGHQRHYHDQRRSQSIVCCKRSGSAVVFPAKSDAYFSSDDGTSEVTWYNVPFDDIGIDDGSVRHVQGFTAGFLRVHMWGTGSRAGDVVPVMCYAWPDGVIDCFACDLPPPSISSSCGTNANGRLGQLMESLVSNGAMVDLFSLLSLDHSASGNSLLRIASEEYKQCTYPMDQIIENLIHRNLDGIESIYRFLVLELICGNGIV